MVSFTAEIDSAAAIDVQTVLSRFARKLSDERALRGQHLHAPVACIGDKQVAISVNCKAHRRAQGSRAKVAVAERAKKVALRVEHLTEP